ncbi:MAG: M20/M25/M40 family metallo-hydrolase [Oscillospiraceae bacterium]|nr:M20/M25/M40 family metallo-hydrolase [Oscillospiraceae bacterium]
MNTIDLLKSLTEIKAVSGDEEAAFECISKHLEYADVLKMQSGIYAKIGKNNTSVPHILIDAHIDSIGFRVVSITDDGFLCVDKCGGIDKRLVPSQKVIIYTGKKEFNGVFCSTPPHLASDTSEICEINQMYIDTGLDKSELEMYVKPGDSVVFDSPIRLLSNGRVSSGALDNRAGCCALISALDMLKDENVRITAVFSNQEEIGIRGAKTAAFSDDYDYVICLDVSFAYTMGEDKTKCGEMGKGPMIGISPILDKECSKLCIATAKEHSIPYQLEVMSAATSTNADAYSITKSGNKTTLVSIPLKYMHTPTEVCAINDIENTAKLIYEFVKQLSKQ